MVLEGHVRKGKKLLPPLMAKNAPVKETTWHTERLPELFWLALIAHRLGESQALELAFQMTQGIQSTVERVRVERKVVRAYLMSEHLSLAQAEREHIVCDHQDAGWRNALRPHFSDMGRIWAGFPAVYLAAEESQRNGADATLIAEVKTLIGRCFHRHDKLALVIQAIAVATAFRAGHAFVQQDLRIPDLNAIFRYPETEESQLAAGFVVTTCGGMTMLGTGPSADRDFTWPRSFWNTCYRLEPCEHD